MVKNPYNLQVSNIFRRVYVITWGSVPGYCWLMSVLAIKWSKSRRSRSRIQWLMTWLHPSHCLDIVFFFVSQCSFKFYFKKALKGWSTYFQFKANKILDWMTILCFLSFSTACQSSTVRKGGQAVASLCNQCWGFRGGPAAIPDYPQNVSDSCSSMIVRRTSLGKEMLSRPGRFQLQPLF